MTNMSTSRIKKIQCLLRASEFVGFVKSDFTYFWNVLFFSNAIIMDCNECHYIFLFFLPNNAISVLF